MKEVRTYAEVPGAIAASGVYNTQVVPVSSGDQFAVPGSPGVRGVASLDITFTGTGTLTAEVYASNGSTYKKAAGSTAVFTALAAGDYLYPVTIPPCSSFYIKLTNTSGANAATVSSVIVAIM